MQANPEFKRDLTQYIIGFVLSIVLTVGAFLAIFLVPSLSLGMSLAGGLGLIQLIVQLKYFLHINGSDASRDKLHLILFSMLILLIIVIGTVWIMGDLMMRMGSM